MDVFESEFQAHLHVAQTCLATLQPPLNDALAILLQAFREGNKLLICGNGGSAADSQHIAAELTGRYKKERRGIAAIALSTDTSALTAIGNDYGFDVVFARQVEALANKGDVLLGISTSGNSKNVLLALQKAREHGCKTIGLSGKDGGAMQALCDVNLIVPSNDTPRIQEMHITLGHILCHLIEERLCCGV